MQDEDNDSMDIDLDGIEVPEIDIEYQEDDGNSNCEGGGCTI